MFETIAFDADDTLWHNETYYQQAKKQFAQLLSKYQDTDYARRRLDEIEVHNIDMYGYGIKMFTLSMIETAIDLSDGRVTGTEIHQLIDISKGMLTNEVELFEHAGNACEISAAFRSDTYHEGRSFRARKKDRALWYFRIFSIHRNCVGEIARDLSGVYGEIRHTSQSIPHGW